MERRKFTREFKLEAVRLKYKGDGRHRADGNPVGRRKPDDGCG